MPMRVMCNVAVSVDGKIGPPERTHASFGSAEDRRRMSLLRRQADAVLTGAATFRACPVAMVEAAEFFADPVTRSQPPYNVILTRSGNVPVQAKGLLDVRVRPLIITGVDAVLPDGLPARVEVERLPQVTAAAVLEVLERRGVRTLLLESGGDVSGMFFSAGVVGELFVTVVPVLLGGRGAPSPVDGPALPGGVKARMTLEEATVKDGELFLHYRLPLRS